MCRHFWIRSGCAAGFSLSNISVSFSVYFLVWLSIRMLSHICKDLWYSATIKCVNVPNPPSCLSSGPTPSPGGFQPSPSPQPSQSPASVRTPQNYGVPSPGPLNTPGAYTGNRIIGNTEGESWSLTRQCRVFVSFASGNPSSVMSPAGATSLEDQQYMEKLKQLSKYIEPLRRMINKIDKNEGCH